MKCINIIIHKKKSLLKLHTIVYYAFISYKYCFVRLKFQPKVLIALNARTKNEIKWVSRECGKTFISQVTFSLEFVSIHTKNSLTFSSFLFLAWMKCINIIIHKKKNLLKLHTIVYYSFISYKYSSVRLKFQPKVLITLNAKTKNEIN